MIAPQDTTAISAEYFLQVTLALDHDLGYHATGAVRLEALDIGAREKLDIRVIERRIHTDNLRVRFAVDQAGKPIERRTPHASTGVQGLAVFFIEQDTERQREGMMAKPLQIVVEFLNARLVADRRIMVRCACRTFRRINPVFPMDVIQMLGFRVIRLEVLIVERPGGRDTAIVPDLPEILLAKP